MYTMIIAICKQLETPKHIILCHALFIIKEKDRMKIRPAVCIIYNKMYWYLKGSPLH